MGKTNPVRDKSYAFALKIIRFCKVLILGKEYVMSKQLLKSGTSIGANIEEAQQAESKKDFISKLSIALKEAHESDYWLRLIRDSGYATNAETAHLRKEADQIISLLTSIIKSAKYNLEK